jgi:polyferredoxin
MSTIGVDEEEFMRDHTKQIHKRSQKDIFLIWMLIIFISVIAAHFVLNITGGTPTGFVTIEESFDTNITILLGALFVAFVTTLVAGLVYTGITKKDH